MSSSQKIKIKRKTNTIIETLSIILSLILLIPNYLCKIKINKFNRMFIDEENRGNIFHGVNVVYKLAPFIPNTSEEHWDAFYSLNSKDIQIMKDYGFNIVRLGITWESVEKKRDQFDYEYLDKMEKLVSKFGEAGIKVIIDAHQDLFSRVFCGEGVPVFYVDDLLNSKEEFIDTNCDFSLLAQFNKFIGTCIPLKSYDWQYELQDKTKIPTLKSCGDKFMKYHQSSELSTSYQAFYLNKFNLQDKFVEFWKTVATKFAKNPHVIGLDLWNEPWAGNIFIEASPFIPGYSTNKHLIPFYNKLYNELKKIDPEFIYLLETVPFPDTLPFFGGYSMGGFNKVPLGNDLLEYQALNLHSYCCMAKSDACDSGEPLFEDTLSLCPSFHKRKLAKNKYQADKLGIPLIITEFGACSDSKACFNEMKGFLDAADQHLTSWAYWMYKPFGDHTTSAHGNTEGIFYEDGTPQEVKERALTRTYIQAYQGVPISVQFDYETGFFLSKFYLDMDINAPSRIYMNKKLFYKDFDKNFKMKITDENFRDLIYEKSDYLINGVLNENYLNVKISSKNDSFLQKFSSSFMKEKEYKPYTSSLGVQFVNPIVNIAIIPKVIFDTTDFDNKKKIEFRVDTSSDLSNTLKIIDVKNIMKQIRIDLKVEYFIEKKKIIKHASMNHDYKLSNQDIFIKKLTIETPYGNIKVQNLLNSRIEINIE